MTTTAQQRLNEVQSILISDIDGTLISETGEYPGLETLKSILANRETRFAFGVATGRSFDLVEAILTQHQIPTPDIVITSVGTSIYYGMEKKCPDQGWWEHISKDWHRDTLLGIALTCPGLKLQAPANQKPFKISFDMDPERFSMEHLLSRLGSHQEDVNLIASHNTFLDILPRRASKGKAVDYLIRRWSIPADRTLACGDSGNDLDMLTGDWHGLVVANHAPELNALRNRNGVYIASQESAAGILEGMQHFNFLQT